MFGSITPTAVVSMANEFATTLSGPLLIVAGFGVMFAVANWISNKIGKRNGGGKRRKRR